MAIDTHDEVAARLLLAAAQADISPVAKRVRAAGQFFTRILIGSSIVAPLFLGIVFWRFMQALQGGGWIPFWFAAVGSVVFLLPPIVLAFYDPLADRNSGLAYRCLYDAAMSDDESLAPSLPVSHETTASSITIRSMYVVDEESSGKTTFQQVQLLALAVWLLVLMLWSGNLESPQAFVAHLWIFFALMVIILVLNFTNVFIIVNQYAGRTVIADGRGLRWRKGMLRPRWIHVSWNEIRAAGRLARLDVKRNKWEHDAYSYFLDLGHALLTWGVNPFLSAAGGAYTPKDMQAEWERFTVFIAAKSELPLRDITPVALAIARATGGHVRERKIADMVLAYSHAVKSIAVPGLQRAVDLVAEQENPQRQRLLRTLAWILLALFVALYVVGAVIQLRG